MCARSTIRNSTYELPSEETSRRLHLLRVPQGMKPQLLMQMFVANQLDVLSAPICVSCRIVRVPLYTNKLTAFEYRPIGDDGE